MGKMVMASFKSPEHADMALRELENLGYNPSEFSVIGREGTSVRRSTGEEVTEGATSGAVAGGAIGGLAGLLAGAGVFPALAGLLIGGPIAAALGLTGAAATALSGAVTGAVAGGLIGTLVNLGVPEDVAARYDETVQAGGVVIGVPLTGGNADEIKEIATNHGGENITIVETTERQAPSMA